MTKPLTKRSGDTGSSKPGTDVRPTDLDAVIHAPKRLMALAILNTVKEAEFKYLADRIGIADSDLSKQMSTLADAGLVHIRKVGGGRSSKTWYSLTADGKHSFAAYRQTLREIVDGPGE